MIITTERRRAMKTKTVPANELTTDNLTAEHYMEMKTRPLGDRVIIKAIEAEGVSEGGIIIPEQAKEKPLEGIVLAVGPGRYTNSGHIVEPEVKRGDRVLYTKYAGAEAEIEGVKCTILRESDIVGVLEDDA